jgi:hypothetical protein
MHKLPFFGRARTSGDIPCHGKARFRLSDIFQIQWVKEGIGMTNKLKRCHLTTRNKIYAW